MKITEVEIYDIKLTSTRSPDFYRLVTSDYDTKAVNSYLEVPAAPGLGIEVDEAVLAQYDCLRIN